MRTVFAKTISRTGRIAWIGVAAACLLFAGCERELDDTYGKRTGSPGLQSVNGTHVFGELFEAAGHRVLSWNRLSPRLKERADCIVWIPNRFYSPSDEACYWLEAWLEEEPGRTLIYVGRGFDAAPWYWQKVEPMVPAERHKDWDVHRGHAQAKFDGRMRGLPEREDARWFHIDRKAPKRPVRTLSGKAQWLEGVNPGTLEMELTERFEPSANAKILLESEGDMLISREEFGESQLIVVTNGSFLLNLPLVNHEHRKLAGRLVDAIGPKDQTVVFLETGTGGPSVLEEDQFKGMPTGLEIFNIWPTNWILLHLALVGILFCFWRFPIFGLARAGEPPRLSDFGKHLDAVGELLKQSGDTAYAEKHVRHYLKKTKETDK